MLARSAQRGSTARARRTLARALRRRRERRLGNVGLLSRLAALAGRRTEPEAAALTRLYRGVVPDEARRSALGDRWWATDPRVASTYAPAEADGAHVLMGDVDESALRILNLETEPGTMFRSIPVESLPPALRRAFPRSTQTVSTHEIAAAAEAMGYQGVSFKGIRDSGYGADARMTESGGDPGRIVAMFDPELVRPPTGLLSRARVQVHRKQSPDLSRTREHNASA